jgi:hypothetical protein
MFRWNQIIKGLISTYISSLKNEILKDGYTPPDWNAQKIAEDVTTQLLSGSQQNSPDDENWPEVMLKAFQLASCKMTSAFDWSNIFSKTISWIRKNKPPWISNNDTEDIANEAIAITLKKWEPFRETDWLQPGLNYTKGVARKLMLGGKIPLASLDERNEEDYGLYDRIAAQWHRFGKPDPAKLAKTIDDWLFDNCPHRLAATFILDIVYEVNWEVCGMMASEESRDTPKAYYDFWYRERLKIADELREYLEKNEHLYCT